MNAYKCVCSYPYEPHTVECLNHNADRQKKESAVSEKAAAAEPTFGYANRRFPSSGMGDWPRDKG